MKSIFASLALTASIAIAVPASAAVVDFETSGQVTLGSLPMPWNYKGFTFSSIGFAYTSYGRPSAGADNGTRAVINGFSDFAIARTNNAVFSVSSLDLGLADYTDPSESVTLTGYLAGGGTVSQVVLLDQTFQTFALGGFSDLTSLTIGSPSLTSAYVALDNLTYSLAAGVPEPTSWALMIGGFGLMGAAIRRRHAAVRVTYV